MRFIHTADWQIGMKAEFVGSAGQVVREERFAAGQRLVARANAENAEFMLVAGDLFEDNAVDRQLVQKTADILAIFKGLVYIIPGNHDPFAPGSVWHHAAWQAENLRVLKEKKPVVLAEGLLFPCPVTDRHSCHDPTGWIARERKNGIRIGMAHGNVEGLAADKTEHPVPRDAPQKAGLDYLALGHWHSTATYTEDDAVRMAYSGTHETTGFGERDSGNALLVKIAAPDAAPDVETLKTGALSWEKIEHHITARGDMERLYDKLAALPGPETRLLDLRLGGIMFPQDHPVLMRIESLVESRFLYARINTDAMYPAADDNSWTASLPAGILQNAAQRLQEMAQAPGPDARAASDALLALYAISREVRP